MVRTELTARRSYEETHNLQTWMVNREYGKRRILPFKIKQTLPAQNTVDLKKNRQVVKIINARRKSKYFTGRDKLIF